MFGEFSHSAISFFWVAFICAKPEVQMRVMKRIGCMAISDVAEFFCDFCDIEVCGFNAGN